MRIELRPHQHFLLRALTQPATLTNCNSSDWEVLLRMARAAKLQGYLAATLTNLGLLEVVPVRVQRQLQSSLVEIRYLQRRARWELSRLVWAAGDSAIPIIVLKGVAYSLAGLPVGDSRHIADLDVLVPGDRLAEFESLLLSKGWHHPEISAYDDHYYRAWSHELPAFVHAERLAEIDVHHTLAPVRSSLHVDANLLFARAMPADFPGVSILCPVDMVLHCAVNLFQNNDLSDDLRDLLDLHEMLVHFSTADSAFWSGLVERATQMGLGKTLYYGLYFAEQIFNTNVPDSVSRGLRLRPNRIALAVMHFLVPWALFPVDPARPSMWTRFARFALYLRSHWIRMPPHLLLVHFGYKSLVVSRERVHELRVSLWRN